MKVTLAQAGIVAGILTLSWVVGGPKEILSAPPTGNHPHQVFNTTSKAHAEKVASLVPESIVKGDSGHPLNWFVMSKTPYAEARSYYAPWLRENDYFRTNQFLSEVKYEAESFSAEAPKSLSEWQDIENVVVEDDLLIINLNDEGYVVVGHQDIQEIIDEGWELDTVRWFKDSGGSILFTRGATIEGLEDLMMSEPYDSEDCPLCLEKIDFGDAYEEPDNYHLCDSCDEAVQEKRYDHAYSAEDEDTTTCEDCGVKIGYDEAIDWEGLDRCEDCYDYWMMKDRQNYTGDETDCISCGFSISPNDVRFELVEGLCPDCKADGSFHAEEFARSNISVPKDWVPKKYPYDRRVVAETKSKWCENCGALDDSEEDAWNHYQFFLKQKNSTKPVMRFISGGACEGCGVDLCENCIDGKTSGNFNPLFEPLCDDCGYPFCKECKGEDRCDDCEEEYQANVCDCCGHLHHAESLADRVPFPSSIPSAGTGSPGQMCEVCNESDDLPYDADYFKNCRRCGKAVCHECWDTHIESDDDYHEVCMDCWTVLDNVARYDAEGDVTEDLAEVRTDLSQKRTNMSALRTALSVAGLFLVWDSWRWSKEERKLKGL